MEGRRNEITPLRLFSYGLIAGLTEEKIMMMNPGTIIDLYLWKREYDDEQHQLKRGGNGGDDDGSE
jgi:hypothetical protein